MTKIPVTGKNGSQMDYLEAELDLASMDNVDVRNELIRLTCQWVAKISGTYMGTYFARENRATRLVHIFLNIAPFLTRRVPLES